MRKKILAVIPARGGSKGIPRKNIKDLAGKPLIAWTIETAKVSSVFDRIIVSTDDQEIADIARQFGADVPFLRPQELSTDTATSIDVVLHLIQWLRRMSVIQLIISCCFNPLHHSGHRKISLRSFNSCNQTRRRTPS